MSAGGAGRQPSEDAATAMRVLALKAAIFILVPLFAAALVVYWKLG